MFLLATVLLHAVISCYAVADEPAGITRTWYLVELRDPDYYPDIVFKGNGDDESFTVRAKEDHYVITEKDMSRPCTFEDDVLDRSFRLENGRLVQVLHYKEKGHMIRTFAREPLEWRVGCYTPDNRQNARWQIFRDTGDFTGEWQLVMYGEYGAFTDASDMQMEGKTVIENGRFVLTFSRSGMEKAWTSPLTRT